MSCWGCIWCSKSFSKTSDFYFATLKFIFEKAYFCFTSVLVKYKHSQLDKLQLILADAITIVNKYKKTIIKFIRG